MAGIDARTVIVAIALAGTEGIAAEQVVAVSHLDARSRWRGGRLGNGGYLGATELVAEAPGHHGVTAGEAHQIVRTETLSFCGDAGALADLDGAFTGAVGIGSESRTCHQ